MQSSRSRCTQNASERATIRKSGFVRAATAARMRSALSFASRSVCGPVGVLARAGVVLDVDRSDARLLEGRNRFFHVEPAFGIRNDGDAHRPGDGAGLLD